MVKEIGEKYGHIDTVINNAGGLGAGIYAAAKGAVLTMTKAMAKELIKSGIRVNAIS